MKPQANIERDARPSIGPQFLEVDGVTMFRYVIDSGNIIGPRKATKADKAEHEGAWRQFNEGRLPQLDHDKDGVAGGVAPEPEAPRRGRPPKPKD
jgi:hypothetical protein